MLHNRYLLLGVITLFFGIAVLTFNFSNEYFALKREASFQEVPSIASAIRRLGLDDIYRWEPQSFWPTQFYHIGHMMLPYAVDPYAVKHRISKLRYRDYSGIALGVLAMGICLAGLTLSCIRRRPGEFLLLATLAVSGFCWAVPVRYNVAFHSFESVFYIGIPLVAYILALRFLRRWRRVRLAPYFAVVALAAFIFSVSEMAGVGQSQEELAVEAELMAEYAAIRELTGGNSTLYIPQEGDFRHGGADWAWHFFLSGNTVIRNNETDPCQPQQPDDKNYMMLPFTEDHPDLLTPGHRHIALYDCSLNDARLRIVEQGRPVIAGDWQVYLSDDRLTYVSPECANRDELFLLHFIPQDTADLSSERREHGFDNRDFAFGYWGITLSDGTCIIERPLPEYDIIAIRTGQYTEAGQIWEAEYRLPYP